MSRRIVRAPLSICSRNGFTNGSVALPTTPTRRAAGRISRITSRFFAASSADVADKPVTLASGRARFVINPVPIGSPAAPMTIGISRVAFFAAMTAGVCEAMMMSTLLRTSSSAMAGRRSFLPLATCISNRIVCPSM